MSLYDTLLQSQQEARKNHEQERLSILQVALAAIKNEKINKQKDLSDADVVSVIGKQIKQLRDALVDFEKAQRSDLVDKTKKEIELLSVYVPRQLSEDEIRPIAKEVISALPPGSTPNFGSVMGMVMQKVKGQADGATVQKIVKELLV
ncbi:MAG: GatB/YqeY domain-containing protein [Candidatus Magasanikbacteria bacterium]